MYNNQNGVVKDLSKIGENRYLEKLLGYFRYTGTPLVLVLGETRGPTTRLCVSPT